MKVGKKGKEKKKKRETKLKLKQINTHKSAELGAVSEKSRVEPIHLPRFVLCLLAFSPAPPPCPAHLPALRCVCTAAHYKSCSAIKFGRVAFLCFTVCLAFTNYCSKGRKRPFVELRIKENDGEDKGDWGGIKRKCKRGTKKKSKQVKNESQRE